MTALIWITITLAAAVLLFGMVVVYQLGTLDGGWASRFQDRWSNWRHRNLKG